MPKNLMLKPLDGFESELGLLLATMNEATRKWRAELGDPPPEAIVWQPRPNGHSIGAVLLHIVACESFWLETFARGCRRNPNELKQTLDRETRQYGGHWPTPPSEPIAWYCDLHDRVRARAFDRLRDDSAERRIARKGFEVSLGWVVAHVAQHEAYHGGQAVLLHDLWRHRT
ncbi:MAG: DinB family protein [Fimbriimonadaceae bacterium]|nr:DinB family protein [Fimbriimonadaceae bacterium]